MKVPARKRGNVHGALQEPFSDQTSMKVPTQRQGNAQQAMHPLAHRSLNESPRPKVGKLPEQL